MLPFFPASYDGVSSVPTPDPSLDLYGGADYNRPPINAPRVIPAPHDFQSDSATNGDNGLQSPVVHKVGPFHCHLLKAFVFGLLLVL